MSRAVDPAEAGVDGEEAGRVDGMFRFRTFKGSRLLYDHVHEDDVTKFRKLPDIKRI